MEYFLTTYRNSSEEEDYDYADSYQEVEVIHKGLYLICEKTYDLNHRYNTPQEFFDWVNSRVSGHYLTSENTDFNIIQYG